MIHETEIAAEGLSIAGGFHPGPEDGAPEGTETLLLLAPAVPRLWEVFAISPEKQDGAKDPLDRWSRRVIGGLADKLDAEAVFPFGGPPYAPFLSWGQKAEAAKPSPVGMLVSPGRGLWVSYRGALCFPERLELPEVPLGDPCLGCPAPCLTACPVGALGAGSYDVAVCASHAGSEAGTACRDGCLVRKSCPAGHVSAPPSVQSRFHMDAFLAAHLPP